MSNAGRCRNRIAVARRLFSRTNGLDQPRAGAAALFLLFAVFQSQSLAPPVAARWPHPARLSDTSAARYFPLPVLQTFSHLRGESGGRVGV